MSTSKKRSGNAETYPIMRNKISIVFLVTAFLSALPGPDAEAQFPAPDLPIGITPPGPNDPPVANNVFISGTPQVGQVLTGNYTFVDAEGDDEGTSLFGWFRRRDNNRVYDQIVASTNPMDMMYTLVPEDEGALIRFGVVPVSHCCVDLTVAGSPAFSEDVGPVTAPNDPPEARAVTITGTHQVGQVLTGTYTYDDAEDEEGASTFRWLRSPVGDDEIINPIDGATGRTYTLVAADEGELIRFEVTPVAQSGTSLGLPVTSAAVGPVAAPPNAPPTASNVSISGIPQVGEVLTGSFIYADAENDPAGASTFRWLRGDTPIAGATAPRYTLGAADQGALVSFEVTPVAQSGTRTGRPIVSAAVGPVAPPINLPPTASNVLISGTAQVGQVLTGSFVYADAENNPQGASTFRWLRGTTPIDGATAPTYTLVAANQGATVSFEVTPVAQTGTSPGLPVPSPAVGPVAAALDDPPVASVVRITGTPQVGQVLTGSYAYSDTEADPQGVSTFRWLRGTTPIAGATAQTYTLAAADQGATVSFEVTPVAQTGTSPGRPVVSAGAGPVAAPTNLPPMASNVLITGTADIGQVLTGSYTYTDAENDPEGASIFRWLRDGTPIAGATAETYTLVGANQGAMVSFEVTPVARTGTSLGLPVVSASGGPIRSTLGRDRPDGPPFVCNGSRCLVPLKCNGVGISCTAQVTLFASLPRARLSDRPAVRAPRRIRFAAGVVNVPPGETRTVRLRVTPRGRRIVNSGTRRILRGILEIRNSPGGVQNIPIRIRIKVRRR